MKIIMYILVKIETLLKSKFASPYILELTVFIIVKIESLKEFSNWISESVKSSVNKEREIMKIIIEKKYLLISDLSVFSFINVILFE